MKLTPLAILSIAVSLAIPASASAEPMLTLEPRAEFLWLDRNPELATDDPIFLAGPGGLVSFDFIVPDISPFQVGGEFSVGGSGFVTEPKSGTFQLLFGGRFGFEIAPFLHVILKLRLGYGLLDFHDYAHGGLLTAPGLVFEGRIHEFPHDAGMITFGIDPTCQLYFADVDAIGFASGLHLTFWFGKHTNLWSHMN